MVFENIVGKGENAGNQHFLLFPQCFPHFQKQILLHKSHSPCYQNVFYMDRCGILLYAKGLRFESYCFTVEVCTENLDIYPNFCTFKKVQCLLDREVELHPDMKPCHDKLGGQFINREYIFSVAAYQKYLTRLGELMIF